MEKCMPASSFIFFIWCDIDKAHGLSSMVANLVKRNWYNKRWKMIDTPVRWLSPDSTKGLPISTKVSMFKVFSNSLQSCTDWKKDGQKKPQYWKWWDWLDFKIDLDGDSQQGSQNPLIKSILENYTRNYERVLARKSNRASNPETDTRHMPEQIEIFVQWPVSAHVTGTCLHLSRYRVRP